MCGCCDQLWYKHHVSSAAKLGEKKVQKWTSIYSTREVLTILNGCIDHVINISLRIKFHWPYDAVNGMQFPPKPAVFDLIELALRLASE